MTKATIALAGYETVQIERQGEHVRLTFAIGVLTVATKVLPAASAQALGAALVQASIAPAA